jgi:hypothetical protein
MSSSRVIPGSTELITSGGSSLTQIMATSVDFNNGHPFTITATQVVGSDVPSFSSTSSTVTVTAKQSSNTLAAIVGGVLGLIFVIGLMGFLVIRRRLRSRSSTQDMGKLFILLPIHVV